MTRARFEHRLLVKSIPFDCYTHCSNCPDNKDNEMTSVRAPQYYRWAKDKPVTTNQTYGYYMQVRTT